LTNDFTVNATSGYEPRFYYTRLIALLGHVAPLPVVCFVLTVLQNAAMAAVTVVVGRRLFKSDDAALAGAVLVLSVTATDLGEDGFLLSSCLLPATLVTPLVLLALWQGVENRPVVCAALAAVAALVHPLIGLALGAIGLATSLLSVLFRISPEGGPAYTARSLFPSLLSWGLRFSPTVSGCGGSIKSSRTANSSTYTGGSGAPTTSFQVSSSRKTMTLSPCYLLQPVRRGSGGDESRKRTGVWRPAS
jgi:hypothetical protein